MHVRPADSSSQKCYELLECSLDTRVVDIKRMIEELGAADGRYSLPATSQVTSVLAGIGVHSVNTLYEGSGPILIGAGIYGRALCGRQGARGLRHLP